MIWRSNPKANPKTRFLGEDCANLSAHQLSNEFAAPSKVFVLKKNDAPNCQPRIKLILSHPITRIKEVAITAPYAR